MIGWQGVAAAILLFGIGTLGLVLRRDLVTKLLALGVVSASAVLGLVSLNAQPSSRPPFLGADAAAAMADSLPQALVLSAIVINFAVLALALVFVMRLVEQYHTTDSQRIERRSREEDDG
ncbi:MAG: sodium:proton antiporter [Candidatus Bipolaricaulia bacterium]